MTCRKRLDKLFRQEKVKFTVTKHAEAYSAQRVASLLHIPGRQVAKVVMVKADDQLIMLVLPAPFRLDMDKVRDVLKARQVRLAREEEFANLFSDCDVGAMPPYGNLYGLAVYVDRDLTTQGQIAFPAGSHLEIIQLAYGDYERTAAPIVAALSMH